MARTALQPFVITTAHTVWQPANAGQGTHQQAAPEYLRPTDFSLLLQIGPFVAEGAARCDLIDDEELIRDVLTASKVIVSTLSG